MIRVDLSIPAKNTRLSLFQVTLLCLGILIGIVLIAGIVLLIQWNSLNNFSNERDELTKTKDSMLELKDEMVSYNTLMNRHDALIRELEESREDNTTLSSILKLLNAELEPGMKLLESTIEGDSVILYCLSPSNVKVAHYVESLSRDILRVEKSEPQASKQGMIEHRVFLRIP